MGTSIAVFTLPQTTTTVLTTFFPDHTTNLLSSTSAARQQLKAYTMADKDKHEDADDFAAINTPGYCPLLEVATTILMICAGYKPAAGKTVDEYKNLDSGDESLARWKASLGLGSATAGDTSGPKVSSSCLRLVSLLSSFILHLAYDPEPGVDLSYTS